MGHLSTILKGLVRRRRRAKQECDGNGREAADKMARDARKNELVLRSSGCLNSASVFSKRGDKATNQDRCIVWEDFGCQRDMIFCGIFDGHGPWGHFVANQVREAMPSVTIQPICSKRPTQAQCCQRPACKIRRPIALVN